MKKILHVSDFHINQDFVESRKKLDELIKTLKNFKIEVDFLVFTGDVIDSKKISITCGNRMSEKYSDVFVNGYDYNNFINEIKANIKADVLIKEYNELIEKETENAYKEAAKIFNDFIKKLGITDTDKVIVCCGNHDKLRPVFFEKKKFECNKEVINVEELGKDFKYFDLFCQDINVKMSHKTYFHSKDGINFIVINTNWKTLDDDRSNEMCIDCGGIKKIFENNKDKLEESIKNNFLITHKPIDDICEDAKYNYKSDYANTPILDEVQNYIGTILCGDKHSYMVDLLSERKTFLGGAPLCSNVIVYNLLYFEEGKGVTGCNYLRWDKKIWKRIVIDKIIDEVYNISKAYIKPICFEMLVGNGQVAKDGKKAIDTIRKSIQMRNLYYSSLIFSACLKGREKFNDDERKIEIDEDKIFQGLADIIQNSNNRHVLNIKGEAGVGKSAFLGIEYLYLLSLYSRGMLSYIPFYFNLEYEISKQQEKDIGSDINWNIVYRECCGKFAVFLENCKSLSKKNDLPIILLIDGMDEKNSLSKNKKTIEQYIYTEITKKLMERFDKYVFAFNIHKFPQLLHSVEGCKFAEKVIYFNSVDITPFSQNKEEFKTMILSYLNLKNINEKEKLEKILKNISKYRKISISLNFLHSNLDEIIRMDSEISSWEVLEKYKVTLEEKTNKIFKENEIRERATNVAYLLYQRGYTFQEINNNVNKSKKITFRDFSIIKNKTEIGEFLVANYYVEEIQRYANNTKTIDDNSILYSFFSRNMAIMIRLLLIDKQDIINKFINNHAKDITGYLYSMLIYLAGHSKDGTGKAKLEEVLNIKNKENKGNKSFFSKCNQRSEFLAKIVCGDNDKVLSEYICMLMRNEELRLFNRCYQLYYYEDKTRGLPIGNHIIECTKDIIKKGFDFHNTFLVLSSKLKYTYEIKKRYKLMEFDLFTLCDLVYSRMQHREEENGQLSLFYSKDYNTEDRPLALNVISTMIEMISKYLKVDAYHQVLLQNDRICIYFKMMLSEFRRVQEILKNYLENNIENLLVGHAIYYEKVRQLSEMSRIGWNISHGHSLSEEERKEMIRKTVDCKETIMDHIIETVYIAFLFLPDKLKREDGSNNRMYDKDIIIRLILARDLGKHDTADYTPFSSENLGLQKRDVEKQLELLNMGAVDGFSDMQEIYALFESEASIGGRTGEINLVISRELALIQMQYKYYILLKAGKISFDKERAEEFKSEFTKITTDVCKKIQKFLIYDNDEFRPFLD